MPCQGRCYRVLGSFEHWCFSKHLGWKGNNMIQMQVTSNASILPCFSPLACYNSNEDECGECVSWWGSTYSGAQMPANFRAILWQSMGLCLFILINSVFCSGLECDVFNCSLDVIGSKIAQNWQHCNNNSVCRIGFLARFWDASMYPQITTLSSTKGPQGANSIYWWARPFALISRYCWNYAHNHWLWQTWQQRLIICDLQNDILLTMDVFKRHRITRCWKRKIAHSQATMRHLEVPYLQRWEQWTTHLALYPNI